MCVQQTGGVCQRWYSGELCAVENVPAAAHYRIYEEEQRERRIEHFLERGGCTHLGVHRRERHLSAVKGLEHKRDERLFSIRLVLRVRAVSRVQYVAG